MNVIKRPQVIIDWMKTFPKVCFNCDNYKPTGVCKIFNESPPEEFLETANACSKWEEEIPF